MDTTVFFASNRFLTGPADQVASYSATIQPPSSPVGMVYGTAFVNGVNIGADQQGRIASLQHTNLGDFDAATKADLAAPGRNLLVFIHGFDNTFSDAITRAAFNREWLAASGIPVADTTVVAFSWPSIGNSNPLQLLPHYKADQSMAR